MEADQEYSVTIAHINEWTEGKALQMPGHSDHFAFGKRYISQQWMGNAEGGGGGVGDIVR